MFHFCTIFYSTFILFKPESHEGVCIPTFAEDMAPVVHNVFVTVNVYKPLGACF